MRTHPPDSTTAFDPFDPKNLTLGPECFKTQLSGGLRREKTPRLKFYKVPAQLDLDLAKAKANWTVWAMVRALYETWFRAGTYQQHPNPFPLAECDTRAWELTRLQKHRALEFLIKTGWIIMDRRDPKNPLVALAWLPLYRP